MKVPPHLPLANQFFSYIAKRADILLRKEAGEPKPWTDDPILQTYKFCNVYRADDRTSCQLIAEFYLPNKNAPAEQILLNAAIARCLGTSEFMHAVGWQQSFDPDLLRSVARSRLNAKQRVFTGAYNINNAGRRDPKEIVVTDHLASLWRTRNRVIAAIEDTFRLSAPWRRSCVPMALPILWQAKFCSTRDTQTFGRNRPWIGLRFAALVPVRNAARVASSPT